MEERMYDSRTCIIIVNVNDKAIGIVVDTVAEVQDIPLENIEPAPNFKSNNDKERFISGLAKTGEDVRIILDVEKIVDIETKVINKVEEN
jgi:purine-binding chemotaxis protein CheW